MAVNTPHRTYSEWAPKWRKCRDAAAGEDAVKAAGTLYLPKPTGQTDDEYKAYRDRAYWFNATRRTVDGLTGLIWRREPQVEVPGGMDTWLEDINLAGTTLQDFVSGAVEDLMVVGRGGLLVDYPKVAVSPESTIAQVEDAGARPYLTLYQAEDVTNWRFGRVGSRTQLTMVVLRESVQGVNEKDEFADAQVEQYRVLELEAGSALYLQRLFRKVGETWQEVGRVVPMVNGKRLDAIPFYFLGVGRTDGKIEAPPIYDLASVNLSHYRTLADLENGAHWTALPTPVFIGLSQDEEVVKLGSTAGIVLPIGGDAKYMEYTAQGLQAVEKRAEVKQAEMAVLGARILAADKRQPETAETAAIHRAGENSVLASIANCVSRVLTKALEQARDWGGLTGEVRVQLNTDYLATPMSPQMLQSLTAALQAGTISGQDYFRYLQRGEVIAPERTYEEMKADIDADPPMAAQIAAMVAKGAPDEEEEEA